MKQKSDLLVSFIKLNKVAREKKAQREGYSSAAAYIHFLSTNEAPKVEVKVKVKVGKKAKVSTTKVIHIVDILDKSGSMQGSKIIAANRGINAGLLDLKMEGVRYTYTLCAFSSRNKIEFPYLAVDPNTVPGVNITTDGYTALWDAIGKTFNMMKSHIAENDKVLVNIYTDGGENDSREYSSQHIYEMIQNYSKKGWTVTFVGTEQDVQFVNRAINIDMSNTRIYDGTAQGLEASFVETRSARTAYTKNVLAGNDVSVGFYKNID